MKQVQTPEFLSNLYRDMRDRRLLLPAAVLLVCLVAIPMFLSSSSKPAPPPVVSAQPTGKDTAAEPAVVAQQQLGVTNYRKRLAQFESKNPFRQQFIKPKVTQSSTLNGFSSSPSGSPSTSTSSSSTTTTTTPSSTPISPSSPSSPSPSPTPAPSPTAPTPPKPTLTLYTFRLHVRVGTPGHLSDRPAVKRLTALPSKQKPIATFLFVNERGTAAVFLLSTDVQSATGDARCVPTHTDCQYVVMRPGDNESFVYGPNGDTYKLRLIDIHPAVVGHNAPTTHRATTNHGKRQPKQAASAGQRKNAVPAATSADSFGPPPRG